MSRATTARIGWAASLLGALAACSTEPVVRPPTAAPAKGSAASSTPAAPSKKPRGSVEGPFEGAAPKPPAATDDEAPNKLAGTLDALAATAAPAPCDFTRTYRGTIGGAAVSWVLTRKGDKLEGWAAYDAGSGAIELRGVVDPTGTIRVTERMGDRDLGRATATCDPMTGALHGDFSTGKASTLRLAPLGRGTTPIVERRKRIGELASTDDDREPSCTWDVRSPAVFGLGDPAREGRINAALRMHFRDEASLEKQVLQCQTTSGGGRADDHVTGWYSIESDADGVLNVLHNGYLYFGPTVHGEWNAGADALTIDVPTGRRLALRDVVTSRDALRPLVSSCIAFGLGELEGWNDFELERNLQGFPAADGEPSTVHDPTFLALPDGLAVLLTGLPTVAAWDELKGIVVSWGALRRAGALPAKSPVARLWANVPALAPGEPACRRVFVPKWLPHETGG